MDYWWERRLALERKIASTGEHKIADDLGYWFSYLGGRFRQSKGAERRADIAKIIDAFEATCQTKEGIHKIWHRVGPLKDKMTPYEIDFWGNLFAGVAFDKLVESMREEPQVPKDEEKDGEHKTKKPRFWGPDEMEWCRDPEDDP